MEDVQRSLSPSSSSFPLNPYPMSIDSEIWLTAEQRIQEILCVIQPALASEQKRKEVIDHIQNLIKNYYSTEVFPFGSVPLKTYLPDGDIDLTTLSHKNMEEELAQKVCNILRCQEQDPEFQIKDIQYIEAQVKLVKCSVKDIPVDISFNQVAGLCALCFLEQVDQIIGRDHLFKRSIILIKAWCFYESRILGAHHGLISTYALEVLILNVINLFHSSLPGPLAVLHRFLEYYSTLDWDNYCVSINGPIPISSFPEIFVKSPENNGNELLLSQEFLRNSRELFSVPIKALESGSHEFPVKHLNIVDPMKAGNNLGRSVNKGNFHRIRCALSYGAHRLTKVLKLPGERMVRELEKFFANTLDRNGKGQRPDAEVPVHAFGSGRSEVSNLSGDYENDFIGLQCGQWYHNYMLPVCPQLSPPPSPSQIHQKCSMDSLSRFTQCEKYAFPQRSRDVFVPRLPFYHPYTPHLYSTTIGFDKLGKSRGTGTYIPDMTQNPYRDILSCMRARNLDSWSPNPLLNSPQKMDQAEDHLQKKNSADGSFLDLSEDKFTTKTEKNGNDNSLDLSIDQFPLLPCNMMSVSSKNSGHSSYLDLSVDKLSPETEKSVNDSFVDHSLDEFPLLPCIKKSMSSDNCQSHQLSLKSLQVEYCSVPLEQIKFGTYNNHPAPFSSTEGKLVDVGVSTSWKIIPAVQYSELQKRREPLESDEKMVHGKQYQLKNDEDFPPLRL